MAGYKGKGIYIVNDDETIQLPDQDNDNLIREYALSLIVKILNSKKQNVEKIMGFTPHHWSIQDKITANDMGNQSILI